LLEAPRLFRSKIDIVYYLNSGFDVPVGKNIRVNPNVLYVTEKDYPGMMEWNLTLKLFSTVQVGYTYFDGEGGPYDFAYLAGVSWRQVYLSYSYCLNSKWKGKEIQSLTLRIFIPQERLNQIFAKKQKVVPNH
jgi:hypothetical protein